MSRLVFNLKHVPDQEADDIRQLLTDNDIPWYETSEGRWKIAVAAIWLTNDDDYDKARQLIDEYQRELLEKHRPEAITSPPVSLPVFLLYLTAVIIVLAVTLLPFLRLS